MKLKTKLQLMTILVVIGIILVFCVYMCMPETYRLVDSGVQINNYSREDFYTEYLDLVIQKQNEEKDESEDIVSQSIINGVPSGTTFSGDLLQLSKDVAVNFKDENGDYDYSTSMDGYLWANDISIAGRTVVNQKRSHRDCSCFVSLMCYFMGIDSNWVHRGSSGFTCFPVVQGDTFEVARVGDIICSDTQGHVEIIVKVDDDYVYFGNCGSTSAITKTATQGYSYKKKKTDLISSWRSSYVEHLHRAPNFNMQ
ncbi:MAG: hypothetical protein IJE43_18965 [Alphaproteobacteria bacterium]|nr:hypothetical protein [Alphaproteobacteria bacterium]